MGAGSFRCTRCGYIVTLEGSDTAAGVPVLRCRRIRQGLDVQHRAHRRRRPRPASPGATSDRGALSGARGRGSPTPATRSTSPATTSAYEEGGQLRTVALTREWTRVGRSLAADVRFDDPTVSRRHALIVRQPDGVRLLDDRSLNGVFVNGTRVDGRTLNDGDEIIVGRYRLVFVSIPAIEGRCPSAAASRDTRLHSVG